ncbi:MAG: toprim domain-containing protein, partial [Gammaproteobacteria bacterium]
WRAQRENPFTSAEREAFRRRCEHERLERQAEQARRHAEARDKARSLWVAATRVADLHSYLRRKRVKSYGLRLYHGALVIAGMPCDGCLIVPARDTGGGLHTLEFIHSDNKRFFPGGDYKAHYFSIGKPDGTLCIAEGYATGATVHDATGHAVAVAFTAGNLTPVARALRAKYPKTKIILCADNDRFTPGNPGVTRAAEAARSAGGFLAVPRFDGAGPYDYYQGRASGPMADRRTDFNDVQAIAIAGVQAAIANAAEPGEVG